MRVQLGLIVAGALAAAGLLQAQVTWELGDQGWCDDERGSRGSAGFCEVRTTTLPATGDLDVDGGANGGIDVEAWDGGQVEVVARVSARASDEGRAEELARAVDISGDGGRIVAEGLRTGRRESWAVSYRLRVPRGTGLRLRTINGGIEVRDVSGDIDFEATNGGVTLAGLAGDVRGQTTNGGLHVELDGDRWAGEGMDVRTTNGGVTMVIPEGYSADLVVGTTNGGMNIDFPVTVQGRLGRELRTTLGAGGSTIRAVTTNGGVRLARR